MIRFTHILCPVDLSDVSAEALRHARALAQWYEAKLTVLEVISVAEVPMAYAAATGGVIPPPPSVDAIFSGWLDPGGPGDFLPRMRDIAQQLQTVTPSAVILGGSALVTAVLVNRYVKAIPGTVAALVIGTGAAWLLGLNVETIGSRFGDVPSGLPAVRVPHFEVSLLLTLLPPALTVATLGAIESLMSAVVADRMSGDRHNPNGELVAQGVANVISPLVGGLPATGAIARTATNIRSGARTPVAGMVHAFTLLAILLVLAPVAAKIPMTVLAALLFIVSWNMGEWHEIPHLLRQTKADVTCR